MAEVRRAPADRAASPPIATFANQMNNNNWLVGNYYDGEGVLHGFYAAPAPGGSCLVN